MFVAVLGLVAEISIFLLIGPRHFWIALALALIPGAAAFAAIKEWRYQARIVELLAESRDRVISYDDFDKRVDYCLLARPFGREVRAAPAPGGYGLPFDYLWDYAVEIKLAEQLASRIQVVGLQNRRAVRRLAHVRILTCEDSQWESAFEALARQAVLVLFDSDLVSPGVKRELEILSTIGALSKTMLISDKGNGTLARPPSIYPDERFKWRLLVGPTDGALKNGIIDDVLNFIDLALAKSLLKRPPDTVA
jgi:hypothetical protein